MTDMGNISKGSFLKEKFLNMARWVIKEIGKENLSVDLLADIEGRTELELVVAASLIQSNKILVSHRDWTGLVHHLEKESQIQGWMQEVVVAIRQKEAMHDKFWRYMELFITVVEQ
jgi:hypothetical protein